MLDVKKPIPHVTCLKWSQACKKFCGRQICPNMENVKLFCATGMGKLFHPWLDASNSFAPRRVFFDDAQKRRKSK